VWFGHLKWLKVFLLSPVGPFTIFILMCLLFSHWFLKKIGIDFFVFLLVSFFYFSLSSFSFSFSSLPPFLHSLSLSLLFFAVLEFGLRTLYLLGKVLYHLNPPPPPAHLFSFYIWGRVSLTLPRLVSHSQSSCLCLQ
jgi:hypothetical protein